MFDRVEKFIGLDNLDKIKSKRIVVVGIGGVGGYAIEGLIRSGVESIIIVDYDIIDITNLNRQIISNRDNIGKYKVDEMEKRIRGINSNCEVIKIYDKLDKDNMDILFNYNFDYLIDCCDNIIVKEELIKRCLDRKIDFISCMGTGNKINPEMLEVIDIRKTSYDPMAKIIRKYLRDNDIKERVMVVCSQEQNDKFVGDIPSMIFVPAVAGLLCANYIIKIIIEEKFLK